MDNVDEQKCQATPKEWKSMKDHKQGCSGGCKTKQKDLEQQRVARQERGPSLLCIKTRPRCDATVRGQEGTGIPREVGGAK